MYYIAIGTTYNHMFDVAFSVESDDCNAEDVTPAMLRAALIKRIETLDAENDWAEACGLCETYEILPSGQGKYVERTL
jgi:hypothetical protein